MPIDHKGFGGLLTNASPHDVPPGRMVEQVNFGNSIPGILAGRLGMIPLVLAGYTPTGSAAVITMSKFLRPEADWLIYERTDGVVRSTRSGLSKDLTTGRNTFQPMSFVRDRKGFFYGYDGLSRGIRWDGLTTAAQPSGMVGPDTAPTVTIAGGGNSEKGDYTCAYRWLDRDGNTTSISPAFTITATATGKEFNWAFTGSTDPRVVTQELYRSGAADSSVLYLVTTVDNSATAYTDTLSDADLFASTPLPVYKDNGSLNARRQGIPPTDRPFVAGFQDRCFWYGSVDYTVGTVAVTNGNATVTVTGGAFNSDMAGRMFYRLGDSQGYLIQSADATTLTLSVVYAGTTGSGASYAVKVSPDRRAAVDFSEPDEYESWPVTNTLVVQENTEDHDDPTGLMIYSSYLWLLNQRHVYQLSYVQQPDMDASISLACNRGSLNNRTWVVAEGTAYLMDQMGIYSFNGSGPQSMTDAVANLFYDGTVDWTQAKNFWCEFEPTERVVRFYVTFAEDTINLIDENGLGILDENGLQIQADSPPAGSHGQPKRAFCFSLITNATWIESYPWELGHGCRFTVNGRLRLLAGGQNDAVYLTSEGNVDGLPTAIRGTATAGSTTTLTDASAAFTDAVLGAPLAITAGTGKGQFAVITARTSTTLTVYQWGTAPDATSQYLIGAVSVVARTGLGVTSVPKNDTERAISVDFQPTNGAAALDLQYYLNHGSAPAPWDLNFANPTSNIAVTQGSVNAVLNLLAYTSGDYDGSGFARVAWANRVIQPKQHKAWLGARVQGFQGADRIKLYDLTLEGVD